ISLLVGQGAILRADWQSAQSLARFKQPVSSFDSEGLFRMSPGLHLLLQHRCANCPRPWTRVGVRHQRHRRDVALVMASLTMTLENRCDVAIEGWSGRSLRAGRENDANENRGLHGLMIINE